MEILFNAFVNLNRGLSFSVNLALIFSTSLGKEFHYLQFLEDIFIEHLIKTNLWELHVKF